MASAKIVSDPESISYLNQREAAEIDEILMGPLGFSVDQLMVSFPFFFLVFLVSVSVVLAIELLWFTFGNF